MHKPGSPALHHRYHLCSPLCPPTGHTAPAPGERFGRQRREHAAPGLLSLAHHLDKKQLLPRPQNPNPKGSNVHPSHCRLPPSLPCQLRRCRTSSKVLVTGKAKRRWMGLLCSCKAFKDGREGSGQSRSFPALEYAARAIKAGSAARGGYEARLGQLDRQTGTARAWVWRRGTSGSTLQQSGPCGHPPITSLSIRRRKNLPWLL